MHFATVDCTVHIALCQRAQVHSYPTTIVYNASVPHAFLGAHSMNVSAFWIESDIDRS